MYCDNDQLGGFFLFDAAKAAFEGVKGAVTGVVKSITGGSSETGSTTPMYVPVAQPPQAQTNWTPYLIGGAALVAVLLLRGKRR